MKKLLFFISALFFTSIIFAQEEDITICLTIPNSTHLTDLEAIRGLDHSNDIFHLKIYVHVLRKQAEPKLGQSIEDVNRQLKYLYDTFDPLDIYFVWNGEIDYIENDIYYGDVSGNAFNIFNTNSHTDGIDIYFFDVEEGNNGGGFGFADDIGGSAILVGGAYKGHKGGGEHTPYSWRNLISHEMGHVLYLFHTFHGTWIQQSVYCGSEDGPGTCPELVDGSNSTTCGDYITDTPADPQIAWQVNYDTDCAYAPTFNPNDCFPDTDANGQVFQPDTSNMMGYTYPTCLQGFTFGQKKRMKNAIWYLPVLHNAILTKWNYLRTNTENCYVCGIKGFTFYTSLGASYFNIIENSNNIAVTTTPIDDFSLTVTATNLNPNNIEGSSGYFILGYSGNEFDNVTQPLWVGLPQAVPDQTVNGPTEASSGQLRYYNIGDGNLRLNGIDTYVWDFPEPNEVYTYFGGPFPNNPTIWESEYFSKYIPKTINSAGNDTGIVTVRGENPCGIGYNGGELNELCVLNSDDNDGDPDCYTPPAPIYYYPNPANSLLEVDLSLQPYNIFDVYIYDEYQTVRYYDQSTNVIKTVDTFNLTNGFYYLHIYDGSNLILSAILIINH